MSSGNKKTSKKEKSKYNIIKFTFLLLNLCVVGEANGDFIKDIFLCSVDSHLEMPPTTEHAELANSDLGYRYDVKFKSRASSNAVGETFLRFFFTYFHINCWN